jgi:hypothetical protein
MGSLLLAGGCHGGRSGDTSILERIAHAARFRKGVPAAGELAEKGRATITEECAKQSYKTASKGLIVSETGLHEDVFSLRDRVSYGEDAYKLDEALQLESLLQAEADGLGRPTDQTKCVREFAGHLETLTDPLIEADERQRELDMSAFKDSVKEAEQQADRRLSGAAEKATEPMTQAPGSQPQ